jgi:hypothetical protein
MDYEFWKDIHGRGGIPAVRSALEALPDDLPPQDADAAAELAMRVIEEDIARINARADRAEERARDLTEQTQEVHRRLTAHAARTAEEARTTEE